MSIVAGILFPSTVLQSGWFQALAAFVEPGVAFEPPSEPFVVKPAVSAGGRSSARFEGDDKAATDLVQRIHRRDYGIIDVCLITSSHFNQQCSINGTDAIEGAAIPCIDITAVNVSLMRDAFCNELSCAQMPIDLLSCRCCHDVQLFHDKQW